MYCSISINQDVEMTNNTFKARQSLVVCKNVLWAKVLNYAQWPSLLPCGLCGVGVGEKWGMRGGAMCTWEGWMGEWGGNWQLVRWGWASATSVMQSVGLGLLHFVHHQATISWWQAEASEPTIGFVISMRGGGWDFGAVGGNEVELSSVLDLFYFIHYTLHCSAHKRSVIGGWALQFHTLEKSVLSNCGVNPAMQNIGFFSCHISWEGLKT